MNEALFQFNSNKRHYFLFITFISDLLISQKLSEVSENESKWLHSNIQTKSEQHET